MNALLQQRNGTNVVIGAVTGAPGGGVTEAQLQDEIDAREAADAQLGDNLDTLQGDLSGKSDVGHTHDASAIVSGTIDAGRLPASANVNVNVIQTTSIAALTTAQQGEIGAGTLVATSNDGKRWRYVSGSKTVEASYLVISDISPTLADIFDATSAGRAVASAASYAAIRALLGLDVFDIPAHRHGVMTSQSKVILSLKVATPFRLPAGLTGSVFASTPPQADYVCPIYKSTASAQGNPIGQIVFHANASAPTVTFAAAVDFASGDFLDWGGYDAPDPNLTAVWGTFKATLL